MGFRSSWIAVRSTSTAEALQALAVVDTGERTNSMEGGLWATSRGEWTVVCGSGWDFMDDIEEEHARLLSAGGEALFWTADDTPMCARMVMFADCAPLWSLTYDGTRGVSEPVLEGDVPELVRAAWARQADLQAKAGGVSADVDHLYETAHEAGRRLVGFCHDDLDAPPGGPPFRLLRRAGEAVAPAAVPTTNPIVAGDDCIRLEIDGASWGGFVLTIRVSAPVRIVRAMKLDYEDGGLAHIEVFTEDLEMVPGGERSFSSVAGGDSTRVQVVYDREGEITVVDAVLG